jgi:hypothetical protein
VFDRLHSEQSCDIARSLAVIALSLSPRSTKSIGVGRLHMMRLAWRMCLGTVGQFLRSEELGDGALAVATVDLDRPFAAAGSP